VIVLRVEEILSKLKGHYLFPITVSFTDKKNRFIAGIRSFFMDNNTKYPKIKRCLCN